MSNVRSSLRGTVTASGSKLQGLRVEVWDASGICIDLIDVALTDARGNFELQLDADYLKRLLLPKRPVLAFRMFDNGKPIGLAQPVTWSVSQQATALQIPLAAATTSVPAGSPASSAVRGTVRNGDGSPAANRVVRAVDRNLAAAGFADTPIGQATTAADGQYEIRYTMPAGGKLKPDLIVRVAAAAATGTNVPAAVPAAPRGVAAAPESASAAMPAPAVAVPAPTARPPVTALPTTVAPSVTSSTPGTPAVPGTTAPPLPPAPLPAPVATAPVPPAAESGLISSAPTVAFVDLSLDDVAAALLSEHATFLAPIADIAARSKIALADLTSAHVTFVAGAAGLQPERVQMMVQAAQLARDAGGAVAPEVFYGLLRTGHDGDLVALAAAPVEVQRRRIQNAIDANLISASHDPDAVITALQGAIVSRALPAKGASIVGTALANSLSTRDVHTAFAARWVGRAGSVQEFWDDVRADAILGPAADDLETTLRLDMLFDGFAPALSDLRAQRQAKTITSMRDLARWQDADWRSFLGRVGTPPYIAGDTPAAKADAYAATLRPAARRAFPTEFLRGRAAVTPPPIPLKFVSLLAAANPDLDLTRPLPDDPVWGSIAVADQSAARGEWSAFQREARAFRAMPARSLLDAVAKTGGTNPVRSAANQFLVATKDLDLDHSTIDQYLSANPKALDRVDATLRPAVFGYLKGVQRVMRIVRAPEAVEPLIADGLDSALRIVRLPRAEFVERYAPILGGEATAHQAFSTAFRTATTAQLALTTTVQSMAGVSAWAIRGGSPTAAAAPDRSAVLGLLKSAATASDSTAAWPTLFEGEAWCDCDDCQSIYGPAAYFVDLLHMLDPDGSDPAPASHLFKRRPDLPNLALTCDNTNIALPYIDVVNEILELHIAADHGFKIPGTTKTYATSTSYDSTGLSAAELRAVPQNVIDQVYDDVLAVDAYPLTLPFHRPLAVMRAYLDQLGTSYADLLSAFAPSAADHGLSTDQRVAAETLGLSRRAFKLIADVPVDDPATTLAGCYGYDATQDPQWQAKLSVVPDLLLRTGISYDDLQALVGTSGTYFMTRTGAASLDQPRQCQIDETTKLHPASDTFNRLHRFIRLWRATGWSIADLDRVLFAVGVGADHSVTLDAHTLSRVAQVKRIADQLEQPLAAVLSLWSDLDTWGPDALYLKLFQNRTVARLDDATSFVLAGDQAKKPADGVGELATATDSMAPHAATILAALRITSSDLAAIRGHALSVDAFPLRDASGDPLLNVHNLTVVYRYTVLAKGLGLRIADLIAILELTGADPFTPNDPLGTSGLMERVRAIQASGCSIATLAYLYQCTSAPGQGPAPADSVMFDALAKIWTALRGVRHDTAIADDPDGTQLAARLALLQPPDVVTSLLAALDPAKGLSPTARKQILDDSLTSILGADLAALESQVLAADPTDPIALAARKVANGSALLSMVSAALRRSLSESAVISVVAGTLGLGDAMTRRLLVEWTHGALDALLALAGGGLNAQRFDGAQFANPEATPAIDEIISWSATAAGIPRGVKWSGHILPLGDGAHTFVLRSDGSCSIAIGGAAATVFPAQPDEGRPLVVDHAVTVTLQANQLVEIDVTYDSGTLPGSFALLWKLGTATTASPIAAEYLFPSLTALVQDDQGPGFVWKRAHKAALLIGGLGLSEDEVGYAEASDSPFGSIDVGNLPMHSPTVDDVHAHLARWQALADFVAVRRSLPISDITLVDALEARTAAGVPDPLAWWAQQLSAPTGWDPAALQPLLVAAADWTAPGIAIVAQLLAGVAGPVPANGPYELGRRLAAVQRCLDLIKRIGVAGDAPAGTRPTLRAWTAAEPDSQAAREMVQAVRARYPDEAQWYQVAQTRNDTLRQLQRDALVAHLLPRITIDNAPAKDVNALYEHFLIDVEMCACGETSRVLQGISTVQLFIQRILLGLEPPISPSRIDPDRWEWNEEYRVWQANREIFLYPENWIDPELRVDKTPFFADLQAQLSQGPLEPDTVEAAFEAYLLKLEQVSRLEICALHWEREGRLSDADSELSNDHVIDTLHVVARTPGMHATYYYRTLLGTATGNGGTEWTPWQKIDVDIQGDGDRGDVHMVLTAYHRRLYLFWAIFAETPEPSQPGMNQGDSPPPPLTHWDIRLGWSTCRNGVWSSKQVTPGTIRSNRYIDIDDKGGYTHAIHEAQHQGDQLRKRKNDAQQHVNEHEHALWVKLQNLRTVLVFLISQRVQQFTAPEDPENDDDLFHQCLYYWLSPLFDHTPNNLPTLDAWIKKQNESFTDFLDKIYQALHVFAFLDFLPNFPPPYVESELLDDYDDVQAYRTARDDAKAAYADFQASYQAFVDGLAPLAVPSSTRRSDHTLWLSTADGVDLYVMRHDDRDNPRELGWFSVSDDGRSVSASAAPSGKRLDIGRQVPHHSDPATNAFRIDTKGHKGLDLEGLPNLLGRVHDARFYNEHWFRHPVTSDSLRPFFISKGSDLEVGLPVADQTVHEPSDPLTAHQGLAIMGARGAAVVSNAAPNTSRDTSAGAMAASADVPTMARRTMELLGDQKSFGLAFVAPNPDRTLVSTARYCFEPFHHPFIHTLIKRLERDGVDGLLTVDAQNPAGSDGGEKGKHFDTMFNPSAKLVAYKFAPYDVDFRPQGPYAPYNWELFFHVPFLIAERLKQDGRYDDARRWLHYIFDPTTSSKEPEPARFWKLEPFRDNTDTLNASQLMTALATNSPAEVAASVHAQIDQWHRYPADPHRIARLRLSAYQKAIVFAYLDNLIAWADSLFTQDTIETINQATQLYVFASHLLGPRPQQAESAATITAFTYAQLRGHLDTMSDLVAEVETMLHPARAFEVMSAPKAVASSLLGISHLPVVYPRPATPDVPEVPLMFCVPANGKLLTYFDTIDDRLFKIRHCMNIEGVVQQLPLFQPPIDPALLVRAAAMGLDLGSILADLSAPLPFRRYSVMVQKALELCAEVRALGGQLLAALEKQDAEGLALLRATHDRSLLTAVLEVKKQQIKEAEGNKASLQKTRDTTQAKYDYYASREFMNSWEISQSTQMDVGSALQTAGATAIAASASVYVVPTVEIGPTGMGVHATAGISGDLLGNAVKALGDGLVITAQAIKEDASKSGLLGGHHRRQDEWNLQKELASRELVQIDTQLAAADIRIAIANLELANQQLQIDNAKKIEDTLRTKYTNTELYSWMVTQISSTYYQAYKLAYDLAKRAERCYRYELGVASSSFIQFGYWDSLRKGLSAGEQLALDLKRMDASFLQTDRRDYEITRHISLVLHDPQAFVDLRRQGACEVDLPEELFDADYPGHYFRRVKSISLTLPCVAGPYTPINCTLTLLTSHVRINAVSGARYPEQNAPNDARFSHGYGAIQSVATSHGQNDAGLFEVNFRDERYLPFEGAGAISRWRIDLPHDCNAFDPDTLSDVVIKLSYTARDGGKPLAAAARKSLRARWATTDQEDGVTPMTPLRRLFRVRYEFSDAWVQFRNALATGDASLLLTIDRDRFPYLFRGVPITIVGAQLIATLASAIAPSSLTLTITPPQGQPKDVTLSPTPADATVLVSGPLDPPSVDVGANSGWSVAAKTGFPIAAVRDLGIVLTYTVKVPPYTL